MATQLILTDVPFTLLNIHLGSLIPNIRNPHQDALIPKPAVKNIDYTIRSQTNFKTLLNSEHSFSLSAYLTKLLSIEHGGKKSRHLELKSQEGLVYELSQPKRWFKDVCKVEEVRMWLEEGIQEGVETWLVVGLRTLRDAKLAMSSVESSNSALQASIPVGKIVGGTVGVPGKALDAGLKGDMSGKEEREDEAEMEGERIYAIGYRKVRYKWLTKKDVDNAYLKDGNVWRSFDDTRADDEEGKFLEVDLEEEDEGAMEEDAQHLVVDDEVFTLIAK